MKYIFLLIITFLISCGQSNRKCTLIVRNGSGWEMFYTEVKCDSFHMISSKEANFYIDGQKMNIKCDKSIAPIIK